MRRKRFNSKNGVEENLSHAVQGINYKRVNWYLCFINTIILFMADVRGGSHFQSGINCPSYSLLEKMLQLILSTT